MAQGLEKVPHYFGLSNLQRSIKIDGPGRELTEEVRKTAGVVMMTSKSMGLVREWTVEMREMAIVVTATTTMPKSTGLTREWMVEVREMTMVETGMVDTTVMQMMHTFALLRECIELEKMEIVTSEELVARGKSLSCYQYNYSLPFTRNSPPHSLALNFSFGLQPP